MPESLLTAQQVAELLHLKPVTVYAAAAKGLIPSVILWRGQRRGLIRFRRADLESWINTRLAVAQSQRSKA